MNEIENEINNCLSILKSGGIILYPTDTIWGLGCDATNYEAVNKLIKLKNGRIDKGFIVLMDDFGMLRYYIPEVPEQAYMISELSEKPVTIIYPSSKGLPQNVLAPDGSIGVRVVKNEFCQKLIKRYKRPITSTSANFSGANPPSKFKDISPELIEKVDYTVSNFIEKENTGISSSIIQLDKVGRIKIIRK